MTDRKAAITAVGHYLPEERVTNRDLEKLVDTSDEWITSRTGIKERRILRDPEKATSYMAVRAAQMALDRRGIGADEIDLIIVATVTPDMLFPATACLVQAELGAGKAWGYDVLAACSGFLFSLSTAAQFIESGKHEKVLVIGADKMSTIVDYTDRTTCILFGDGAGAVLLEADTTGYGLQDSIERVDGNGWQALCMPGGGSLNPASPVSLEKRMHYLYQDGKPVFKKAVVGMAGVAEAIMKRNKLTGEDVRYLVPHQANLRIIDATARRMGISMDKVMLNIERYGNTTAATLPLCLADWEHELVPGDNLILAAFGGGYTWAAAWLRWAYDAASLQPAATQPASDKQTS